ncbi:MAG: amino acid permease, partial [Bowdeniella nasicola]|nr:amino acid permease [Bowdeniella nasicola]
MTTSRPPTTGGMDDSTPYSPATDVADGQSDARATKLSVPALAALVVGSMVGSGIFALPQNAAEVTAAGPAIIGWIITAVGMFALARVFQDLANRRPDLDAGVYAYARALFGRLIGFISAWGYWFSAWVGNIAYFVLLFGTMSIWFGGFEDGTTWVAIICASILLWLLHTLVLSGVKQAAFVNTIVTLAKLVPIVLFVILAIVFFSFETFKLDFWGTQGFGSIFEQTKHMMLLTVWVFIGIEGASVYSAHARKRSDVGKATIGGFVTVLLLLMLVNLLSLGVMSRPEVAALDDPSMAGLMAEMIGKPGAIIISVG